MRHGGSSLTGAGVASYVGSVFGLTFIALLGLGQPLVTALGLQENLSDKFGPYPVIQLAIGGSALIGLFAVVYFFRRRDPEATARRLRSAGLSAAGTLSISPMLIPFMAQIDARFAPWVSVYAKISEPSDVMTIALSATAITCFTLSAKVLRPILGRPAELTLINGWNLQVQRVARSEDEIGKSKNTSAEILEAERQIGDVATIDVQELARRYITPTCQQINPADHNEANAFRGLRIPLHEYLAINLRKKVVEKDGTHVLFILSDAGMGKTSLLVMLRMSGIVERIWPPSVHIELLKLGDQTLEFIKTLKHPGETVLLLDSLDEDSGAHGHVTRRLRILLDATVHFRQVIITSRTYFFPYDSRNPLENNGYVRVSGYRCGLVYLTPFSDKQTQEYLRRSFAQPWWRRLLSRHARERHAQLPRAQELAQNMRSLRMRPMLLAHIDRLLEAQTLSDDTIHWTEWTVYDALVDRWLEREHLKGGPDPLRARRGCERLALELQRRQENIRLMSTLDFNNLTAQMPDLSCLREINKGGTSLLNQTSDLEWRFSHFSVQEFLVVSALLRGPRHTNSSRPAITDETTRFIRTFTSDADFSLVCEGSYPDLDFSERNLLTLPSIIKQAARSGDNAAIPQLGIRLYQLGVIEVLRHLDMYNYFDVIFRAMPGVFRHIDLRGFYFRGAKLGNADFTGAEFSGTDLRGTHFQSACLTGATFTGCSLTGADLSNADLSNADLSNANLSGSNLQAARLHGANLREAKLTIANLKHADLRLAKLCLADLRDANLHHSDLRGADLHSADLRLADLCYANLAEATLINSSLCGADLRGANLHGTDIYFTDLSAAVLQDPTSTTEIAGLTRKQLESAKNVPEEAWILVEPGDELDR